MNTYVSVQLSFLNESERRCTHAVARTFCPDFDHHMEVSCDLLQHGSSGEARSLAEELQEASAVFTLWNKDSHTGSAVIWFAITKMLSLLYLVSYWWFLSAGERLTCQSDDVMLGTVKIPLIDLIHKRTGKLTHHLFSKIFWSYKIRQSSYSFILSLKVFLDGLEYIYIVLLNTGTSWLEGSMSLSDLPTTQTGKKW